MSERSHTTGSPLPSAGAPFVPDHEILRCIGSGSYGEVWLARNIIGTYRAVKIVHRSRFVDERPYEREFRGIQKFEPLSRTHPGLVNVLQIGRNEEAGFFYYVMEVGDDEASGQTFHPDVYSPKTLGKELLARERLPFEECLDLGISLADALAHLHRHGLIHRDIKPSNIIFVNGQPKLADIGLVTEVGETGSIVGTEGFIAPEGPSTAQADVFSLGKVLYEISTGKDRKSFPELPTRLEEFSDDGQIIELNEVILKACAPAAANRYVDAEALHADLLALRAGKSVKRLHFLERQIRRVTRVAAVAAVVAIVAGVFLYTVYRAREREKKSLALAYVSAGSGLLENQNFHGALPYFVQALELEQNDANAIDDERTRLGTLVSQAPRLMRLWKLAGPVKEMQFSANGKRLLASAGDRARVWEVATGEPASPEFVVQRDIETAIFSPSEDQVLISANEIVRLYDVHTGDERYRWTFKEKISSAQFSPNGKWIAFACADNCAYVFDAAARTQLFELASHSDDVLSVAFSPDSSTIVTASSDETARFWRVSNGTEFGPPLRHSGWVYHAAFSPDGQRVVTACSDGMIRTWNAATREGLLNPMQHEDGARRAFFCPDGRSIVSAGVDQTVRVWSPDTGKLTRPLLNHDKPVMHALFAPEGRRLATADHGGTVKIWDLEPEMPEDFGNAVFNAGGSRRVTFTNDVVALWNSTARTPLGEAVRSGREIHDALWSADSSTVLLLSTNENGASACVAAVGETLALGKWLDLKMFPHALELSADGSLLFAAEKRDFALWDLKQARRLFAPIHQSRTVRGAAISPDKSLIVTGCGTDAKFWDAQTGREAGEPLSSRWLVSHVQFSRDGSRLLVSCRDDDWQDCASRVWDVTTRREIGPLLQHNDGIHMASFSADERYVVTAGEDNRARVWETDGGQPVGWPLRHKRKVWFAHFSENGRWVITGGRDQAVRIWETETGFPISPPFVHSEPVRDAGFFSGNGRFWVRLETHTLVWNLDRAPNDSPTLRSLVASLGSARVLNRSFGRAGNRTKTTSEEETVRPIESPALRSDLAAWHLQQADACEREEAWFGMRFHLHQLVRAMPANADFRARFEMADDRWRRSQSSDRAESK